MTTRSSLTPAIAMSCASVVLACLVGACAGHGTSADAAPDASLAPAPPNAPASPAAPSLTPCRAGWNDVPPVGPDDPSTCELSPSATIGTACTSDPWATGLPMDRPILYVQAGAAAAGSGTRALPFATIVEALAAVTPGTDTIVAVAQGSYDETVTIPGGVTVWGACVESTRIASTSPADLGGTVTASGSGAILRNLSLGGARAGAWVGPDASTLELDDVLVDGATDTGLEVFGVGTLTATGIVVRDTHARPSDGHLGRGLTAAGGHATLRRSVLAANLEAGVLASGSAHVELDDVAIRDTQGRQADGAHGYGLIAFDGATVVANGIVIERSGAAGIMATGAGVAVSVTGGVVRDTNGQPSDGTMGRGVDVESAASFTGAQLVVERSRETGLFVTGASAAITDGVIRDTRPRASDQGFGRGASADLTSSLRLERVLVARNRDDGVLVLDGSEATLTDLSVLDTGPDAAMESGGMGLTVGLGALATVERGRFARDTEVGALVVGSGSSLTLDDVTVEDTHAWAAMGLLGRGLDAELGAGLSVTRALVRGNLDVGVFAGGAGTALLLTDVEIDDTSSRAADGFYGEGLDVQQGAQATVERLAIAHGRNVGVVVDGAGSRATMLDVVITDTMDQACAAAATCAWDVTSHVGGYDGATIDVRRFLLARSPLCGVELAGGAAIDLHDGVIADNRIGADVQDPTFDVTRLGDHVAYVGNEINLDSALLPVPPPESNANH